MQTWTSLDVLCDQKDMCDHFTCVLNDLVTLGVRLDQITSFRSDAIRWDTCFEPTDPSDLTHAIVFDGLLQPQHLLVDLKVELGAATACLRELISTHVLSKCKHINAWCLGWQTVHNTILENPLTVDVLIKNEHSNDITVVTESLKGWNNLLKRFRKKVGFATAVEVARVATECAQLGH